MRFWLVVVAALVGCVSPSSVTCGDGRFCPTNTVCVALPTVVNDPVGEICALPDDLEACAAAAEGATCPKGACHDGVCMPIVCGNGYVDPGEQCDDHNNIAGDGCSADCMSSELCGNGVRDGIAFEQCDDGNLINGDGCDSQCRPEHPQWSQLALDQITARRTAMAFDLVRDQAVLFGGIDTSNTVLSDTWIWEGMGWRRASPRTVPTARHSAAMAYDPIRRQVVLFGGIDGATTRTLRDTWLWDGRDWSLVITPNAPTARDGAAMVFDGRLGGIVLFGGHFRTIDNNNFYDNDTWLWNGASWKQITTATLPEVRTEAAMAYDPLRDTIVMFGGTNALTGPGSVPVKTWTFDGTDWHSSMPQTTPTSRFAARMAWDATTHTAIMFGGSNGTLDNTEMWVWTGSTWVLSGVITKPTGRSSYALAADPARGAVILFGGTAAETPPKTWSWNGSTWADVSPAVMAAQQHAQGSYDLLRGRAVVNDSSGRALESDGNGWALSTASLTSAPFLPGTDYDLAQQATIVFGGANGSTSLVDNETWSWKGTTWTQTTPTMSPPARQSPVAYDVSRQRLVLFGGVTDSSVIVLGDTWEYDGATWKQLFPAHSPPPRGSHMLAYDWIRKRVVLFSGYGGSELEDTWTWDGTDWTDVTPAMSPAGREGGAMVWDPRRGSLIMFGANAASGAADTWEWDGAAWNGLSAGTPPLARANAAQFRSRDGALTVFGGRAQLLQLNDSWQLRFENDFTAETCANPIDLDGDGLAGCADPDCWYVCNPTCQPNTTCDPNAPHCGDGVCNAALETCAMCPQDCGACPVMCGDAICAAGETAASCPGDCH